MSRNTRIIASFASAALTVAVNASVSRAQMTATPARQVQAPRLDHRELPADQQILHALSRLSFGARPSDVRNVRSMGLEKWIDQQLHPERIDDSSLEKFLAHYTVLRQDQNELLRSYSEAQRERRMVRRQAGDTTQAMAPDDAAARQRIALNRRAVIGQLQSHRVARAVASNRQLEEVMTDFWLNHFNVFAQKGPPQAYYLAEYERDVIRPNALGKFRDLLGAVAKSPAMLFYLDNARSMGDTSQPRLASIERGGGQQRPRNPRRRMEQDAPQRTQRINQIRNGGLNENYGRELLELHTLGVDGGYTQQDVIHVARALTGWTIRPPAAGGGFIFRPEMHDAGEKIVLGRKLKPGRGIEDGEAVLDIVARHPSTARYIATKLARRFVSDDPPQALVDEAASVFLRTDGDLRAVVRTIITSNEFFSRQAYRSKVKSPFEVVVSAMRAMNAPPDSTPRTAQAVANLGQPIYGHQAPNGWPETGEAWMNAGAILNRINFGVAVAGGRLPGARPMAIPGIDSLVSAPRAKQVDAVVGLLLGGAASADTRAVLLSGENPLLANAVAMGNETKDIVTPADQQMMQSDGEEMAMARRRQGNGGVGAARGNPLGRPGSALPQLTGIAQVVGLALGSPEFQRR